jgi:hypothetical protein
VLVLFSFYFNGGEMFADGLYCLLLFYFGFLITAGRDILNVNSMALYRYGNLKMFYFQSAKKLLPKIIFYIGVYTVIGKMSMLYGRPLYITPKNICFFMLNAFLNLCILSYVLINLKITLGNTMSVAITSALILISVTAVFLRNYVIAPVTFYIPFAEFNRSFFKKFVLCYVTAMPILALFQFNVRRMLFCRGEK